VEQAHIERGQQVLDLGCGTATLTLLIKEAHPDSEVTGLDGDSNILQFAKAKAARAGLKIKLEQGMSFELPFPDNSFDRILSSLFFHHLTRENKEHTLKEVYRVLRAGGELHIADWGKAQNWFMKAAFISIQLLDGFTTTEDNIKGMLPELIIRAGFKEVQQMTQYMTAYGSLCLYSSRK
jgi:ubiquinone/menaquinone biosynthesis C-methylase UbiE